MENEAVLGKPPPGTSAVGELTVATLVTVWAWTPESTVNGKMIRRWSVPLPLKAPKLQVRMGAAKVHEAPEATVPSTLRIWIAGAVSTVSCEGTLSMTCTACASLGPALFTVTV